MSQIKQVEEGEMRVNTFLAKELMEKLAQGVAGTSKLYVRDVKVIHSTLGELLQHEALQAGLNLTHTQVLIYKFNV